MGDDKAEEPNFAQRLLNKLTVWPRRIRRYPDVVDELKHVKQQKSDVKANLRAAEDRIDNLKSEVARLDEQNTSLKQTIKRYDERSSDPEPDLDKDRLMFILSDYDWTHKTSKGDIQVEDYLPRRDELGQWWDAAQEFDPDTSLSAQEIVDFWFKLNADGRLGWTYKRDGVKHNLPEVWEDPWTAWTDDDRTGDCETKSGCMAGFILAHMREAGVLEDNAHRLLLWAGRTVSEGHACLKWWADDGHFYTVESTLYQDKAYETTWLSTPVYDHYFYYDSFGLATIDTSHKSDVADLKRAAEAVR